MIEYRKVSRGRRPTILVFGDSITERGHDPQYIGWVSRLEHHYSRKADIINRGFSGYNTRWLSLMLNDLFSQNFQTHPPALVTIWLGANDASLDHSPQHVPLEEYKTNLHQIVHFFQKLGPHVKVLVITPPPLHEAAWGLHLGNKGTTTPDRLHLNSKNYGEAAIKVARQAQVGYIDMYAALEGNGEPVDYGQYLHDGLHLNEKGNEAAFEAIQEAIVEHFPQLESSKLESQAPEWHEMTPTTTLIHLYRS